MKSPFALTLALFLGAQTAPALDLLGYWNFDDNTDPASAPNVFGAAPAAILGGPAAFTEDAGGFSGAAGDRALDLGGVNEGSHATTAEGPHFDAAVTNNAMSVSFWQFRREDGSTSSFWVHSPDAGNGDRGFQAHVPWGNGTVFFDQSGCCDPPQRLTVAGSSILNQWQHFVFQRDADGNREIWVDGTLAASLDGAEPLDAFNGILTIGAEGPTKNNSFGGIIDEMAIFDDALTAQQIALLAAGNPAPDLIDTTDADGDGLLDAWEQQIIDFDPDDDIQTIQDVLPEDDFDMDGLDNVGERDATTDPTDEDSDDDGLLDGVESGSGTYVNRDTDTGTEPKSADSDGDGLGDGLENPELAYVDIDQPGTDPNKPDTDEDGFDDNVELDLGSDPTDPNDTPLSEELTLLAYWDFNDNSDPAVTLDIMAGHSGELQGGAAYTEDAGGRTETPGDYGMDFGVDAGGQTVLVSDAAFLNVPAATDSITIVFWQKNAATESSSTFWAVSPSSGGNERGMQAHLPWGNGTMYFDSAGCCAAPATRIQGAPPGEHDWMQWHHYAIVKNFGAKEVWIDGALILITPEGANPLPTDFTQLWLGSEKGNNSLQAVLDDFAIYDRALTEEQIGELAAGAAPIDLIVPPAPFAITSVVRGADGRVTITFNTRPNKTYAVDVSTDAINWDELDDGVEGEGGVATFKDESSDPSEPTLLYRAREL